MRVGNLAHRSHRHNFPQANAIQSQTIALSTELLLGHLPMHILQSFRQPIIIIIINTITTTATWLRNIRKDTYYENLNDDTIEYFKYFKHYHVMVKMDIVPIRNEISSTCWWWYCISRVTLWRVR